MFSSIPDIRPGTIPLLVQMPDGAREQIDVPVDYTVDQVSSMLGQGSDDVRLSFNNIDLPPNASLLDTNIVPAYEHASSLLQVINNSDATPDAKAAALDSACAVVESVSNGIKDMEALCQAAMEPPAIGAGAQPVSPRTAGGLVEAGREEAERETPKELGDGEFKTLHSMFKGGRTDVRDEVDMPKAPTATELIHGLSRRLPDLFPPSAMGGMDGDGSLGFAQKETETPTAHEQPSFGSGGRQVSVGVQPSIASIRAARRKAKENMPVRVESEQAASVMTIGHSTNGVIPTNMHDQGAPGGRNDTAGSSEKGNVWMASNAKSTWLEDVMKTWEVGVVRKSGVLEKSKDGQELGQYLNGLEAEAQREVETESMEIRSSHGPENSSQGSNAINAHAGDSEDEEEDDSPPNSVKEETHSLSNGNAQKMNSSADSSSRHGNEGNNGVVSGVMQDNVIRENTTMIAPASVALPSTIGRPTTSVGSTGSTGSSSTSASKRPPRIIRQATKIAPAPMIPSPIYPAVPYPGGMMPSGMSFRPPAPPGQKKRGRKRKNPELTDEERALMRKEQNRESAKLSRVRRKVIAAEYEGRLKSLVGENAFLRKQVEGLNNRLVYLQSLLTVSVRPEPTLGSSIPGSHS